MEKLELHSPKNFDKIHEKIVVNHSINRKSGNRNILDKALFRHPALKIIHYPYLIIDEISGESTLKGELNFEKVKSFTLQDLALYFTKSTKQNQSLESIYGALAYLLDRTCLDLILYAIDYMASEGAGFKNPIKLLDILHEAEFYLRDAESHR